MGKNDFPVCERLSETEKLFYYRTDPQGNDCIVTAFWTRSTMFYLRPVIAMFGFLENTLVAFVWSTTPTNLKICLLW